MKRFVIYLSIISVVVLSVNFFLFALLSYTNSSRTISYLSPLMNSRGHYKVLVTGDSHAANVWRHLIDSSIFDDFLIVTYGSDNQIDIQRKILYLKNKGITFEYHLYEFDPQIISPYRDFKNNNDLTNYLTNRVRLNLVFYFPLFTDKMVSRNLTNALNILFRGGDYKKNSFREEVGRQALQFPEDSSISIKMRKTLKENIGEDPIIGIKYPVIPAYLQKLKSNKLYKECEKSIHALKSNIIMLDFESILTDSSNFVNQDHVNNIGARNIQIRFIERYTEFILKEGE